MYSFRDIYVYVMYYVYVTSGPSLLIESTDSMILDASLALHISPSNLSSAWAQKRDSEPDVCM